MSFEMMRQETSREIAASRAMGEIIAEISSLKIEVPKIKVQDDAGEVVASEYRARVKTCAKQIEEYRQGAKAPYLEVGKMIDNMFRALKESCVSMTEQIDKELTPWKSAKFEAAEMAQKKAMEEALEAKDSEEGVTPPAEITVQTATATDSGKTYMRKVTKVEVVDPVKLVKAAMDNRNQVPFDVVQINDAKLKQVAVGDTYKPKEWAKYGVRVYTEDELATRT